MFGEWNEYELEVADYLGDLLRVGATGVGAEAPPDLS
jgi:hypothetical protein